MGSERTDVLIVGAGVIGLAASYRLARAEHRVLLIDASGSTGSSWAAAGMLAPVSEATFGETELTTLNLAAVPAFVRFAAELEAATGEQIGLRTEGTLVVAFNADDKVALDRLSAYRDGLNLTTKRLTGRAVRGIEPYLASEVRAGVLAADDLSVDNRRYLGALRTACEQAGVRIQQDAVVELIRAHGKVQGVRLGTGQELKANTVLLCSGAATQQLLDVGVQPVKGKILRLAVPQRLQAAGPVLGHTVRGLVRGTEVYLVPRADGEIVVGATSEQQGYDTTVTAGGVYELLRNAYELLPISSEFSFVEARAGTRPGTADNGPLVGELEPGLLLATGHYRNGVLLSALTADAVTALVNGDRLESQWDPFDARRFRS
jgi:glycine oxidase